MLYFKINTLVLLIKHEVFCQTKNKQLVVLKKNIRRFEPNSPEISRKKKYTDKDYKN